MKYPPVKLEVEIDRAKWLTGSYIEKVKKDKGSCIESELLSETRSAKGMMCCLGFACKSLGLPQRHIAGHASPTSIHKHRGALESVGLVNQIGENTVKCQQLMTVNDASTMPSNKREQRIKKLGRKIGIRFTFKGRAPKTVKG
jgi:hypothetical protein